MADNANSYVQVTGLSAVKTAGRATVAGISGAAGTADILVPAGTEGMWLQAEAQNVRFTLDGSTPTAAVGMLLLTGQPPLWVPGYGNCLNLKAIETTASAKLNIQFLIQGMPK